MTWMQSLNISHTMQSTTSLSRVAVSVMAMLISVYLLMASDLSRPPEHSMWSMGNVCVSTTRQAATAGTAHLYTMIALGRRLMAKQGLLMSAGPASAMDMPIPVTLTLMSGRHQGTGVVVSATTVSTTQKGSTASGVNQASTVTSGDPSLPQTHANHVPAILLDQLSFHSTQ